MTEGEASLWLIELIRRQPEIEEDAIEWCNRSLSSNGGEIGKVSANRDEAPGDVRVLLQRRCAVNGGGIDIEGENDPVRRRRLEECPSMTAATEGAVQVPPARSRLQCSDRLREEHGPVAGR